jgi:D-sedoheptulose 7-phosphate isomerase
VESQIKKYFRQELFKSVTTLERIASDDSLAAAVEDLTKVCCTALRSGKKILLAGNGGSAADAQHLAGELVSRLNFDRPGLAAFALTTDSSVLTAVGNDYGYEKVFSRQLDAVGSSGDVFIAISTSGRSPNILRALEESRRKGIVTVGFTGTPGGAMPDLCDYCIQVPASETPKIQEGHIVLGHILCGLIECEMFGGD